MFYVTFVVRSKATVSLVLPHFKCNRQRREWGERGEGGEEKKGKEKEPTRYRCSSRRAINEEETSSPSFFFFFFFPFWQWEIDRRDDQYLAFFGFRTELTTAGSDYNCSRWEECPPILLIDDGQRATNWPKENVRISDAKTSEWLALRSSRYFSSSLSLSPFLLHFLRPASVHKQNEKKLALSLSLSDIAFRIYSDVHLCATFSRRSKSSINFHFQSTRQTFDLLEYEDFVLNVDILFEADVRLSTSR